MDFIVVVKKTFVYTDVFLQPLMPQFHISEYNFNMRYKYSIASLNTIEIDGVPRVTAFGSYEGEM